MSDTEVTTIPDWVLDGREDAQAGDPVDPFKLYVLEHADELELLGTMEDVICLVHRGGTSGPACTRLKHHEGHDHVADGTTRVVARWSW